jgi:hypothetical protein
MAIENCRTCRFYRIEEETRFGIRDDDPLHKDDYEAECRRFPPTRGDKDYWGEMEAPDVLRDFFSGPIVQALYWCGEWSPRNSSA